jgi:hypothetical protein
MVPTSGRGANRLNKKEAVPVGIKGTCAGKEVGGVPAASGVGGDILKNIGGDDYVKWFRVHIKVTIIFWRSGGVRGVRGSLQGESAEAEQERSGKGGKCALGAERSGGRRSRVSEGTPRD